MPQTAAKRLGDRLAVYLVADPAHCARPITEVVAEALAGGVTSVQLRSKVLTDREVLALAIQISGLCLQTETLFIVNDRIDLALASGAAGVHLGVDDIPLEAARLIGGSNLVIGYSPETDEQAATARTRGADYLGVGPVFSTATKLDAGSAIGLDVLRRRVMQAGIPVIGIGGVNANNAVAVIETGAIGVAVVSAILSATEPRDAAISISNSVRAQRSES